MIFFRLLRWELRLQARSWRTRAAVLLHLAVGCGVPLYFLAQLPYLSLPTTSLDYFTVGGASIGANVGASVSPAFLRYVLLGTQQFLTLVLAVAVAGQRARGTDWQRLRPILTSAPLSNAAYLLGRWLALAVLLLSVAAVPQLVTAAALVMKGETVDAKVWLFHGAVQIALFLVVCVAGWLGTVTICRGEILAAAVTLVVGPSLVYCLRYALHPLHLTLTTGWVTGSWDLFRSTLKMFKGAQSWLRFNLYDRGLSDAPELLTRDTVLRELASGPAIAAGLAFAVLGLAVLFVERTRRDLKPAPEGAPRVGVRARLRWLRERHGLSAGLLGRDRLSAAAGIVLLVAGFGFNLARQRHFFHVGEERYALLKADPVATTDAGVETERVTIDATLGEDGTVSSSVRATLVNTGETPASHLAFTLDEALALVDDPIADAAHVTVERHDDRLGLDLEPPLSPGKALTLAFELRGVPRHVDLEVWDRDGFDPFIRSWERHRDGRMVDASDLSFAQVAPSVSRRRVSLPASDLMPLPRTAPWTLSPQDWGITSYLDVPTEENLNKTELTVSVRTPASWTVADACGNLSEGGVLAGGCLLPLGRYQVRGGPLEVLVNGRARVAFLPTHRKAAEALAEDLRTALDAVADAWPGSLGEDVARLVVVEDLKGVDSRRLFTRDIPPRLWKIRESTFQTGLVPHPMWPVGNLLADELLQRRDFRAEDEFLLTRMLRQVVRMRLGTVSSDARVSGDHRFVVLIQTPILEAPRNLEPVWDKRLPAVLVDLQNRIGPQNFVNAFDAFLSAPGEGTFDELAATLEEHAEQPLGDFFGDYFRGGALPELLLENVKTHRVGSSWEVRGTLRNAGTGHVACPVRAEAEDGSHRRTLVLVGPEDATAFSLRLETRPTVLQLDPLGTCHRLVNRNSKALESVDLLR